LLKSASESQVREALFSFSCKNDADIEDFLIKGITDVHSINAIQFEKTSKSRTYLLVDLDELSAGEFVLLAYFTIALQVLKISDLNLSKSQIKKLDGFSATKNKEQITDFPVFLIGQIGKNDTYKSQIKGDAIIESAMSIISRAQDDVGGRIVLVECADNPNLIKFYQNNKFKVLNTSDMVQLIRMID
jgi:hypothetical protein